MSDVQIAALHWGVKQSFRSYVEAVGGQIALSGPAERAPDGGFVFAAGEAAVTRSPDGRPQGQAQFSGEVRFEAHGGMLKVAIADPGVELGPDGGALTVADPWAAGKRMAIAKLDVAAAVTEAGEVALPAVTTIDGMQLLGDHYPPGTQLDPVRLKLG
ncbi:HtaA domain-containing protein [Phenylobacterium terrae]|uniref:HtaA domain-containing protein n=1 Tax=Phenylobacterium terrae TaxID=2665495 RepID=A0ABW4N212_9CAUL